MSGYGAWCHARHDRWGLVSNQDRNHFDATQTLSSVSVCDRPECITKAIKYVAGRTNQTATYQPDEVQS